jgi:hypothetical protein
MRSLAGTSAGEAYRSARADRRRRQAVTVALLVGAAAAGWAALQAAWWFAAIAAASLVLAWLVRARPDPERWLRGAAGEMATAQLLDELPSRRWTVLHDVRVPGSRANIDHLVIGPSGLWVVDSKTTRARVRTSWRTVWVGERRLDSGPVQWEAQVVTDRLGVEARPLIVLHGSGLRRRGARASGVRVVPPATLLRRLRRGRRRLLRPEVRGLADRAESVFRPAFSEKGPTSHG